MGMMIESSIGLQVLNTALLAVLIFIYVRNLTKMKSNFTVGLLIFASFLLVQNLLGIYFGATAMDYMNEPFENYAFFINITETVALLALFWISLK
jgi:hypothetical protein